MKHRAGSVRPGHMVKRATTATLICIVIPLAAATACSQADSPVTGLVVLTEWKIAAREPSGVTLSVRNDGSRQHQLVVSKPGGQLLTMTDIMDPGQTVQILLPETGPLELTSRVVAVDPDGNLIDDTARGMFLAVDWKS